MTYAQLLAKLQTLNEHQLAQTVSFYNCSNQEMFSIEGVDIVGEEDPEDLRPEDDILDKGHLYMWTV